MDESYATVEELLAAVRLLVSDHGSMPVVLRHDDLGNEPLVDVVLRSASGGLVDLYSDTSTSFKPHVVASLASCLARLMSQGAACYEVNIFHPGLGSEPLVEITTDGASLILTT